MNNSTRQSAIAAEISALQSRAAVTCRANAEPLPGPLAAAFLTPETPEIRHFVAGDFILLRELDSPLYRRLFELAEHGRRINAGEIPAETPVASSPFTAEQCAEMLFQFLVPLPAARVAFRRGRKEFTARAIQHLRTQFQPDDYARLQSAVIARFHEIFSSSINYEVESEPGEETVSFNLGGGARRDGLGWWFDYVARLCHNFPWPKSYVIDELPMIEGYALLSWTFENNGVQPVKALHPRYIGQECERLLAEEGSAV